MHRIKSKELIHKMECIQARNPWFDLHSMQNSLGWVNQSLELFEERLSISELSLKNKLVFYIPAQTYPLFGFFESLSLIMEGYKVHLYSSPNDLFYLDSFLEILKKHSLSDRLTVIKEFNRSSDLIIIDESETSKSFRKYLSKYTHLIIPDRQSFAVIDKSWTKKDYFLLCDYLLSFFGRSPFNIKQLLIEEEQAVINIFENSQAYEYLKDHHKYYGKYEYELTKCLLAQEKVLTNQLFTLKKESGYPNVSIIHYQLMDNIDLKKYSHSVESETELFLIKNNEKNIPAFFDNTPLKSIRIKELSKAVEQKFKTNE